MRKVTSLLLSLFLLLAPGFAAAQAVPVHVSQSPTAAMSHPGGHEAFGFDNWVTYTFRHCQAYQSEKRFGFLHLRKHMVIDVDACNADPSTVFNQQTRHNLVTNAGFTMIEKAISDTATQPASCNYVAVTNTAITPGATDTTLSGEIAANGLTRAIGTFTADSPGAKQYTVAKTFSATGTQASQASGLFNASSTGTMCYEATYTQVTVNNGDTLTVTWTVTLS